jgi:C4-dicarboxylate-specific signal transduction histidine kinase
VAEERSQRADSGDAGTTGSWTTEQVAGRAVARLNVRSIALVVGLNLLVAAVLVGYDIYNDFDTTRTFLTDTASHAAHAVHVLRARSDARDRDIIDEACVLTACEMALVTREGRVFYQSHEGIGRELHRLDWPSAATRVPTTRMRIERRLGELSGAWWLGPYDERLRLLVIVPRRPEQEGLATYLSTAAALTGVGLVLNVLIMLVASNWVLRRPLVRLIDALTSALVEDVRRRREAEQRANAARIEAEQHLAELRAHQRQLVQSSRLATLGEMAAGVAHELNQPLNNIGLLASRAERRIDKAVEPAAEDVAFVREKLGSIAGQVGRAARIIDHLRVFGRAEPAPLADVDVRKAVAAALELVGEQLRLHGVELLVEMPEGLPPVRGDLARLEQVFINLVVNARFALDEKEKTLASSGEGVGFAKRLAIRAGEGELRDGTAAVVVRVEDNGPGMSEEVAARIFDPFFTTKEVGEGTGLGLSISYGIVEECGGALEVETASGRGATFIVALRQAETGVTK